MTKKANCIELEQEIKSQNYILASLDRILLKNSGDIPR